MVPSTEYEGISSAIFYYLLQYKPCFICFHFSLSNYDFWKLQVIFSTSKVILKLCITALPVQQESLCINV